jgi:hypothetical protein
MRIAAPSRTTRFERRVRTCARACLLTFARPLLPRRDSATAGYVGRCNADGSSTLQMCTDYPTCSACPFTIAFARSDVCLPNPLLYGSQSVTMDCRQPVTLPPVNPPQGHALIEWFEFNACVDDHRTLVQAPLEVCHVVPDAPVFGATRGYKLTCEADGSRGSIFFCEANCTRCLERPFVSRACFETGTEDVRSARITCPRLPPPPPSASALPRPSQSSQPRPSQSSQPRPSQSSQPRPSQSSQPSQQPLPSQSSQPSQQPLPSQSSQPSQQPLPSQSAQPSLALPSPSQSAQPSLALPSPSEQPLPSQSSQPLPSRSSQPRPSQSSQPRPSQSSQPRPSQSQQPRPSQSQQPRPSQNLQCPPGYFVNPNWNQNNNNNNNNRNRPSTNVPAYCVQIPRCPQGYVFSVPAWQFNMRSDGRSNTNVAQPVPIGCVLLGRSLSEGNLRA